MSRIIFVTHPDVAIGPAIPAPRWPLSELGRARMAAFAEKLSGEGLAAVWTSQEHKALDGDDILSGVLGVPHHVDATLGEDDRSSTGYLETAAPGPSCSSSSPIPTRASTAGRPPATLSAASWSP